MRTRVWDRPWKKALDMIQRFFHIFLVSRKAVTFQATRSR